MSQISFLQHMFNTRVADPMANTISKCLNAEFISSLASDVQNLLAAELSDVEQSLSADIEQATAKMEKSLVARCEKETADTISSNRQAVVKSYREFFQQLFFSAWWSVYAGWYDGGKVLGVKFDEKNFHLFRNWCKNCPIVWPGEQLVIVTQNPRQAHWRDNVLHNEDGPAVWYDDGFKFFSIEGIPVDEQIVMQPETQTIQQIEEETNADVKEIRIRRFGWPRYLKETNAKEIDRRMNEIEGTAEALYESSTGKRLVVTCPTARVFALGVPNETNTCEEAVKWLNAHTRNYPSRVIART